MTYADLATGWVSYTRQSRPPRGKAVNAGAAAGAVVSWLQQPGFIVGTAEIDEGESEIEDGQAHMLRHDVQAALQDVLEWCAEETRCS